MIALNKMELMPIHDNRKSFYSKAIICTNGREVQLYSYKTLVASVALDTGEAEVYKLQSQTTLRHVKEFLKQRGLRADTKAQIKQDYYKEL